ncbi:3-hydroxyisobutyrate dehydrogenase [Lactobacillus colini]|uniref:3-hydroxyisobutyrate dehydrogenase n=1 Tax=Lactobacillus colini TaxID=1819254 RepID=A0ABS4MF50_9LACO|nr:NAD(P)-dependent oxidoreductase [Lactobacillus colini]MBP2058312.1 3-hydroxyisobutyrate dehydrogenase [Lactobacillus colini]
MKIGFIGTGVMGTGVIKNLLKHNHEVMVFNRTKNHAQEAIDAGASWIDSPAQLAQEANLIFTMVGFPADVEEVYFGKNGLFKTAHAGQFLIDMTTSKPSLAKKIGHVGEEKGVHILDAPVSGGDIGAKNGTLTVFVGGKKSDYEQIADIFASFSKVVNYFGDYGSGQHAKMANQIMIAGTMTGMVEMLVYAKAAHLNLEQILKAVQGGSAENFSLGSYGPRILKHDFTPGFFAKHFLKDLRIALDEADEMNLDLPGTRLAKRLYEELVDDNGLGNDGTQALIKLWWHDA